MKNSPAFFGGDASDLGSVRRLTPSTFRELVDQVLNMAVPLNVTREQYAAMDKASRHRTKRVPYVVPCTFAASPSQRLAELAQTVTLLCLDVDEAAHAAPFLSSPETIAEQLMPFNFAVHTTASSTPEAPRVRVLVEAAHLPPARYGDALGDVARRLGLPLVNKESRVVVQPMYLPTIFRGETAHPLLWAEAGGRAYTLKDILGGTGDDPPLAGDGAAPSSSSSEAADDDLDFLRPVVDEVTLADAASALGALDPDCTYGEWLEVAAALRHQFPTEPLASSAYELFDEWSSGGTKYAGTDDTRAKWSSLRPSPRGRAPVTIRTVLTRAKAAGWTGATAAQERLFAAVRTRIKAYPDATVERLMHEGIDWIAATPLLTKSEEEALLQEIVGRLRRSKIRVSLASLRKDLRTHKQQASATQERKERIPTWAKGLCYVGHVNQFFRPATGEILSPEALDRVYGSKLLPSAEQLKDAGDSSLSMRCAPVVRPQDFLLNHVQVASVYDYEYDPSQPNDAFIHADGRAYVNTYVRNYPEPDVLRAEEAGALFQRHMELQIPDEKLRLPFLHFMAHIVQRPGVKIRWAVLLQGAEGCGKTLYSDALSAVLGAGHVRPITGTAITGDWNDWATGHQLVTLEEVRVAGQNRHEVMNKLKDLITNSKININQRHRDSRMVPNRANYLLFTNYHDALAVNNNDRRYYILKCAQQTKEQVAALGGASYFRPLFEMLRDNAAGLRAWLESVPIPDDFPTSGPAPVSPFMEELVRDAASEPLALLREILHDGDNPLVQSDVLSSVVLRQMLSGDNGQRVSGQYVATLLRDEGYVSLRRLTLPSGAKHTVWGRADATLSVQEQMNLFHSRAEATDPEILQELL